jgi:hypothetical protein
LSIARSAVTTLTPSSTGMLMSRTIASGLVSVAERRASAPSTAVATSNPESRSPRSSDASTSGSSSTTSTRGAAELLSMAHILPDRRPYPWEAAATRRHQGKGLTSIIVQVLAW